MTDPEIATAIAGALTAAWALPHGITLIVDFFARLAG